MLSKMVGNKNDLVVYNAKMLNDVKQDSQYTYPKFKN